VSPHSPTFVVEQPDAQRLVLSPKCVDGVLRNLRLLISPRQIEFTHLGRLSQNTNIWFLPLLKEKQLHAMEKVVDWIDRAILLTVEVTDLRTENYPMDLLTFDCIMRASSGYLPEAFYSHDVRRIMNFLGLLAERSIQNGQESIDVMVGGQMHTVVLEEGDVIVVSGTS
jgi:hypothetical protein